MIIRPYKETDYEDILEISKHIWDGEDYLPKLINEYEKDSHCRPFVVEEDGRVVSVVNMHYYTSEFLWLEAMRTHPDFRNKGIATKLNQYLYQKVLKSSAKEFWLSTSLNNEATTKILSKASFDEITLLDYWENSSDNNDQNVKDHNGVVNGLLVNIEYLEFHLTEKAREYSTTWIPAKNKSEIKAIMEKQSPELKKFPYLAGEFTIFPLDSYFVESWLENNYILINKQTNSILTFKPGKEFDNTFVLGIFDLDSDVILSALNFAFNQVKTSIRKEGKEGTLPDIKLFYPHEANLKLLTSDWVFRIMRKTLSNQDLP